MIESLIEMEGKRTISRINDNTIERTDVSNDIKFVRNTKWTKEELMHAQRQYFSDMIKPADVGFYIIDDTVLEKPGKPKHMKGLGWHFSHSKGRAVYGHCMVSSHYRIGNTSFPYEFEFYRSEKVACRERVAFKSKIDIAKEFIGRFMPFSEEKVYVLLDSWYTSKDVIGEARERDFHIIGGLKGNRIFKLREHGKKHKLSIYARNSRNASFEEISVNGAAFLVKRVECWLPDIGQVVILISKRKKDGSRSFILSTDMALSNGEILRYYSYRWDIETGYLYCKDRLGLGHYQMRSMKAIEKYCAIVFAAFCYLESMRVLSDMSSIGQSRWQFKMKRKRQYVDRIVKLARRGVPMNKIYKELNIAA